MYNLNVFNRFGKNYSKEGDKTGKPQKFVHFLLWTFDYTDSLCMLCPK